MCAFTVQTHLLHGTALGNITIFLVNIVNTGAAFITEENAVILNCKRMAFRKLKNRLHAPSKKCKTNITNLEDLAITLLGLFKTSHVIIETGAGNNSIWSINLHTINLRLMNLCSWVVTADKFVEPDLK